MSIVKRMYTTVIAGVDQLVGEIENHDAAIAATIQDQNKKIAAAKVQLNRLQTNEKRCQEKLAEFSKEEQRWSQRALAETERNQENIALQCLQRRKLVRVEIVRLQQSQQQYQQTIRKISNDIQRCEQTLNNLKQKHELMRARQTSADAINNTGELSESTIQNMEQSFDRWEVQIAQHETEMDLPDTIDNFEQAYLDQEQLDDLQAELKKLIDANQENQTTKDDNHGNH